MSGFILQGHIVSGRRLSLAQVKTPMLFQLQDLVLTQSPEFVCDIINPYVIFLKHFFLPLI